MSSDRRAADTLVTLGFLDAGIAERTLAELEGGTWQEALTSSGLSGIELDHAMAVVTVVSGPLGDDAVTPEADGRYDTVAPLGKGGMGSVVRCEDAHLHREVARKELLVNHPAIELRFLREARITAQLEHPGIVPVYELGRRADGTLYYTMKEVKGHTLREAIDGAKSMRDRLALLGVFVDLCQAVGYAHSKGVVHRDLKPENVMIGAFGETTVLDWGLAKVAGEPDAELPQGLAVGSGTGSDLTRAGTVMGTPKYMSPEQAEGSAEIDPRSDVWSIGIMLYELLCGEVPFDGPADSVLRQVREGLWTPVHEVERGVPPALAAICNKALGHAPAERYDTADEVADELEAWRTGATVGAHTYTAVEQMRRAGSRFRLVLVGAAGLAIGALVVQQVAAGRLTAATQERDTAQARAAFLEDLARAHATPDPAEAVARFRHALAHPAATDADRAVVDARVAALLEPGNLQVLTTDPAGTFRWTPSGGRLGWARGSAVALVDPDSGSSLGEIAAPGPVVAFAFTNDEQFVWIATEDGTTIRASMLDKSEVERRELPTPIEMLVPSPDGKSVRVETVLPNPLQTFAGERDFVASGSTVEAFDDPEGRPVQVYAAPGPVERVAVNGGRLAVGGPAGLVVWPLDADDVQSNLRVCPDGRVVPVLPFPRTDDLGAPSRACEAR